MLAVFWSAVSCESALSGETGEGELRISFESMVAPEVRAVTEIPDTSDFLLTVANSAGTSMYEGKYGDCPESMKVAAGNYIVSVRSGDFEKPAFASPQYGDSQCVVVEKDGIVNVGLVCRQLNSGIRLSIAPAFLTAYPDGVLFLKAAEGRLMYSYSEKRVAYFKPGPVSLILNRSGKDEVLSALNLFITRVRTDTMISICAAGSITDFGTIFQSTVLPLAIKRSLFAVCFAKRASSLGLFLI